nr:MAG TPA: hypothetical protein [Caudoviricetes sp.]
MRTRSIKIVSSCLCSNEGYIMKEQKLYNMFLKLSLAKRGIHRHIMLPFIISPHACVHIWTNCPFA